MTVDNERGELDDPGGRTSPWTWIAAGVAVLFVRVVLIAATGGEGNGVDVLAPLAAVLIVVGLVKGSVDWLRRRGR